jgi:hypothetical protein
MLKTEDAYLVALCKKFLRKCVGAGDDNVKYWASHTLSNRMLIYLRL